MRYFILLFLACQFSFAQAFVQNNKMSIQGVARDTDNVPKTDEDLSLTFFLYYYLNNTIQFIVNETETVSTDDFGVFNHTIDIPKSAYDLIATYPVYVRVSEGGVTYSDEKVLTAPYAIYAHNGVPTGSIVAFRGTEEDVPEGWVLCDGRRFPDNAFHKKLVEFLGDNQTPDLRGQFLRGTGNYFSDATKSGPSLNQFQEDAFTNHSHPLDLNTFEAIPGFPITGFHSHQLKNTTWHEGDGGVHYFMGAKRNGANTTAVSVLTGAFSFLLPNTERVSREGDHSHTFEGETETVGWAETRPPNKGVNFIIKI